MSREIAQHLLANQSNVTGALDAGSYIALASAYLSLEAHNANLRDERDILLKVAEATNQALHEILLPAMRRFEESSKEESK